MTEEHRVTGRRLRRFPDPETSDDPRVVFVIEQLRAVDIAPLPRAHFRAELRAQLVAVTPRLVAEGADVTAATGLTPARSAAATALADRPRPTPRPRAVLTEPAESPSSTPVRERDGFWTKMRAIPLARPLAIAASVVTLLAMVLGGAVWMSQDSVPGDTLYGLKRAGERFELSNADNDTERAQLLLQFATTRVEEANELLSQPSASAAGSGPLADGRVSGHTADLIAETLSSADDNTRTASRLLGVAAVKSASGTPLAGMKTWAPEQIARLGQLRSALPADNELRSTASKSAGLVKAVQTRAATLQKRVSCHCLSKAPSDSLGPVPSTAPVTPRSSTPKAPATKKKSGGSTGGAATTTAPNTPGRNTAVAPSTKAPAPRTSAPKLPKLPLPSLSVPSSTASRKPILDLCKVSLLGIKICPSKTP